MADVPPLPTIEGPEGQIRKRPFGVLIVEDEPDIREALGDALKGGPIVVHEAGTLDSARGILKDEPVDLVLIDVSLPDGDGLDLSAEVYGEDPDIETIIMTGQPSLERAVEAIRVGASDFLSKPLNLSELNQVVNHALQRRSDKSRQNAKIKRLTHLCRKLNKARHQVTQHVDVLCNDLVSAYQELSGQMKQIEAVSEFKSSIAEELDLEELLRRFLEFTLNKIGPTNAVIFLPSQSGGWTVGGYVNYSCDRDSISVLLQHLSQITSDCIAESQDVLHLTSDEMIENAFGEPVSWLDNMQVIATACKDEDEETLAVVMLFRDNDEPYTEEDVETVGAVAPTFGRHLVKVINVHHRGKQKFDPEAEYGSEDDYNDWDSEWDDDWDGSDEVPF